MSDITDKLFKRGMHNPSQQKQDPTNVNDDPDKTVVIDKSVNDPDKKVTQEPTDYSVEWDKVKEEQIFSHLTEKAGREIKSWEDLQPSVIEKEVEKIIDRDLPPEIEAALKFHNETGRGLSDFGKTQKDWTQVDDNSVLREYLVIENPELTREHIDLLMEDYKSPSKLEGEDYTPEEIADNLRQIKLAEISRIKDVAKARKFFEESKAKYLTPLEAKQKELELQVEQGKEVWSQRTQDAMQGITGIEIGEFSYSFKDRDAFTQSASSIEELLGRYKDGEGQLDHSKLLKTLIAGEQLESILNDYGSHIEAQTIKNNLESKVNPTLSTDPKSKQNQTEDKSAAAKAHLLKNLERIGYVKKG